LRSYANFTWHDANLIAKLEFRAQFNDSIRNMKVLLRKAQYGGADAESEVFRLTRMTQAMERTRDYIMAPPNEAQQIRAIVSLAYLGLNVKTALLNMWGLTTTWADMTEKRGVVDGTKIMLRATRDSWKSIKLLDLNAVKQQSGVSKQALDALNLAMDEGILSQSYAYHLAGLANAGNLSRLPAHQTGKRVAKGAMDAAMYVFRLTELSTRRISFLSNFEHELAKPGTFQQDAYERAVANTNLLQNDYSLGNRVPFMRGFKMDDGNPLKNVVEPIVPLATIFMSFAQHMAFHTFGGYQLGESRGMKFRGETPRHKYGTYTMKLWILTLLVAGYTGLPGAENILDLLEVLWRKFGGAKPVRQMLREHVKDITGMDPQLAAYGFGHNFMGFDISRSVGFGKLVPGTDTLAHPGDSMEKTFGSLVLDLMGPTGSFVSLGLNAMYSNKSPAEIMSRLPGGMGNIYTAYKWTQEGVRAPTGALVTHDLETGKIRDLTMTEIAGKALGFNPTIVSQNREVRFNQWDRQVYWQSRRKDLLDDYWKATWQKDKDAIADTKRAVAEFNEAIPEDFKEVRIRGADIAKSMNVRRKQMMADEQQRSTSKRYQNLYVDVAESYDRP